MASRREIKAAGTPATLARMLGSQPPVVLNAGGTTQGTAPLLTNNFAEIVTTAANQGVRLPPAMGQYLNVVLNSPGSGYPLSIYPAATESISFASANQPIQIGVGQIGLLVPSGNAWMGMGGSLSGALTLTGVVTSPGFVVSPLAANAAAGQIGEYVTALVGAGNGPLLVSTTPAIITTISLTAGDWDVWGQVIFNNVTAGSTTVLTGQITTGTTITATADNNSTFNFGAWASFPGNTNCPLTVCRMSLTATTTVYLLAQMTFSAGAPNAAGKICARRVR